jgi:hypothetical protein
LTRCHSDSFHHVIRLIMGHRVSILFSQGVCAAVMKVLAQMLSGLHGVNVLSHSDIRTYIEQDPDLPPVDKKYGPLSRDSNNYAHDAIKSAIQKGARKKRKSSKGHSSQMSSARRHGHELSDDAFIQRRGDAYIALPNQRSALEQ